MTTTDSSTQSYTGIDDLSVDLPTACSSVTMNRPDSLNSLTAAMLTTIADTLERAATDPRVKVVRLGGAGRGFSSGAGISEEDQARKAVEGPAAVLDAANRAVRSIVNLPQPAVAVVQGPAAGVGVSLALACDVVLASEKAFFMLAFTKIGLMPDGGASALIAAAVGRIRAMRMALLAERISGRRGLRVGPGDGRLSGRRVRRRGGQGGLHAGVRSRRGAAQDQKRHQHRDADRARGRARTRESRVSWALLDSPDFREGTRAFQQRRSANFTDS